MRDDEDVELTEADMNDVDLLSELSGLMGDSEDGQSLTEKLFALESKISQEKSRCLKEKRAGNVDKAQLIYLQVTELMKEAAELRSQIQNSTETTGSEHGAPHQEPKVASPQEQTPPLVQRTQPTQVTPPPAQVTPPPAQVTPPPQSKRHSDDDFGLLDAMMGDAPVAAEQSPPTHEIPHSSVERVEASYSVHTSSSEGHTTATASVELIDTSYSASPLPNTSNNSKGDPSIVEAMETEKSPVDKPTTSAPILDILGVPAFQDTTSAPTPAPNSFIKTDIAEEKNLEVLQEIKNRIVQCKVVAKKYKDSGDKASALNALRVMKTLERIGKEIDEGVEHDLSALPAAPTFEEETDQSRNMDVESPSTPQEPPKIKATASASASASASAVAPTASKSSTSTDTRVDMGLSPEETLRRARNLEMLEAALQKQIASYMEKAKVTEKEGNRQLALSFLKLKKVWTQDLEKINLQKKHPFIPAPLYHFEDMETKKEILNHHLAPHHLEIQILEIKHLKPPQGYDDSALSLYILGEFPYPNEETKQEFRTTPVPLNPPYFCTTLEYKKLLKIERKKSLELFVRNKKMTLALWHSRGWLFRDVALGRVEVKLSPLVDQCSFIYDADILEGRKPTGGVVTLKVSLRTPAGKPQIEVTKDRILFIDKHFSFEDALQMQQEQEQQQKQRQQQQQQQQQQQNQRQQEQQRQQQEEQKKLQQQRQEEQSSKRQKTEPNGTTQPTAQPAKAQPTGQPTQPQPQPQKSKPQQPAKPQVDPDSVDWIVSNFVLECEIKETEARIEELKKAGEEDEVLELEIRVQLLNLQSARIIELVNNGQLTMDVYVQMVKNRIEDEEKLAAQFTAKGQKSKAAAALKRASWMREEIGA
eukprot:TRINITY_DN2397_c0_g2_i1.p1 TRINITY_DN2397_c0_g2~~TRINITY_DN2397_c0_g2_i1.p1  ORF type:complete len:928 (+),score=229.02 TRINITY_DN2397_c0_g2_i1:164-2785(+)